MSVSGPPALPTSSPPQARRRARARRGRHGRRAKEARSFWRPLRIAVASIALAALAATIAFVLTLNSRIHRYEVEMPATPGPETWLILALDDRAAASAAITAQTDQAESQPGVRADVLLLATQTSKGIRLTSVPRKTLVAGVVPETPTLDERIGLAWLEGPHLIIDLFCRRLNVPVDHLLTLDLQAFVDIVDALGGVEVDVPAALRDPNTQLDLQPGPQLLDGLGALGYARTRQGQTLLNGQWVPESADQATGEGRRRARQLDLVAAIKTQAWRTPWRVPSALYAASGHLGLDAGSSVLDLLPLRAPTDAQELPTLSDQEVNTRRLGRESVEYLSELGYVTPCEPPPAK